MVKLQYKKQKTAQPQRQTPAETAAFVKDVREYRLF